MSKRYYDEDEDAELNFDEEPLEDDGDLDAEDGLDAFLDKMDNNDLLCTEDFALFDGAELSMGRVSLQVYADKEGRFFACDEEPRFNPFTGKKVGAVHSIDDIDSM